MATVKLRDYLLALSSKGTAAGDSDKITILDSADSNAIKTILKSDLVDLDSIVSELQDDFLDQFGEGTFSGSAQVDHDTTTNFVANEHIDHTSVSIIAGDGLTGGGDISSDRTINIVSDNNGIVVNADQIELDTDSSTFSGGVLTKMNIEQVVSGSSQVILNDADKTGFDTADVVEGTNLYYTDVRVLSKINTEGVLSGSTFSSPSQGTLRATINGVDSDVDLGLQSGDNVTFTDGNFTGNVVITGNLDVLGDAVEIQTSDLRIEDKLITVASGSATSVAADGAGLEVDGADKSMKWNHSTQQFVFDAKVSSSVGFKGEGGELTGIDTDQVTEAGNLYYTNTRVLDYINDQGVISGSSQVNADSITNFDSNVKDKLNDEGVISGSSQITITESQISDLDHYTDTDVKAKLNVEGVLSGSSQIDVTQTTNYSSINQYTDSDNLSYLNSLGVQSGSDTPHYTDSDNLSYLNSLLIVSKSAGGDLDVNGDITGSGLLISGSISLNDAYKNIIIGSGSSAENNQPYTSDNVVIGRNINPTSNTTTKNENVLVGNNIGFPRGTDNTFIGHGIKSSGGDFTSNGNTVIGNNAGSSLGGASYNVIIGLNAATEGTALTNGDYNTFIGSLASTSVNSNQQYSIAIGYSADSKGDNTTYIGTPGQTTHTYLEGVITGSSLDVSGDITGSSFFIDGDTRTTGVHFANGLQHDGDGGTGIYFATDTVEVRTQNNPSLQVDSSGNTNVLFDLDVTGDITGSGLSIIDTSNPGSDYGSVVIEGRRDGSPNVLTLRAKDNGTPASALPQDQGAVVRWQGFDGTDFANMGYILVAADGQSVAASDAPSYMAFGVTPDASETPSEVMRLDSDGVLSLNDTSNDVFINNNGTAMEIDVNRHPETGVFSDTGKGHARISLIGDTGGSKIQFKTANAINTTATTVAEISSGSFSVLDNKIEVGNTSVSANGVTIEKTGNHLFLRATTATAGEYWNFDVDANNRLNVINDNSVGVYIDDAATSWTGTSDERLKNINYELTGSLSNLQDLRAVNYSWVSGSVDKNFYGLIAQDVEEHYPDMISEDRDGYKGIRYTEMIPVLVSAIKEQQSIIDDLKSRIETLENS